MAIIAHVVLKGVTKEQYDAVRAEVNWLGERPAGGLAHLSWWEGDDNHNTDAWEDEAAPPSRSSGWARPWRSSASTWRPR
jgi:hypothetical protein